jgi:chloramphenicol 3-O-phosphotransferase
MEKKMQKIPSQHIAHATTADPRKVVICGVPRAGKSTLGRQLAHKLMCPYMPCDPLVTAFQETYPAAGIYHTNDQYDQEPHVSRAFTQFLITYITHGLDREMASYVVEGFHIDISLLYQHLGKTHTIIVVGYPNITAEEKYDVIRRIDGKNAWTSGVCDKELRRDVSRFVSLSQQYYARAHRHGIPFVDTSRHHIRTIFALIADYGT